MTRTATRMLLGLGAIGALALTACSGGGDSGRPSAEEIAAAYSGSSGELDMSLSEEEANCFGTQIHDSDLSDELVRELVKQSSDFEPTEEEASQLIEVMMAAATECSVGVG